MKKLRATIKAILTYLRSLPQRLSYPQQFVYVRYSVEELSSEDPMLRSFMQQQEAAMKELDQAFDNFFKPSEQLWREMEKRRSSPRSK